ncbi:hypothetical protein F4781DRAFT_360210 [Annulohypoxylon bovei var. microspora]|nr:hypothetical protein F4781DRAFT_360210 [Annulohypoxylon bovei var. microspora]
MCQSTGWVNQPVKKPTIKFVEHVCGSEESHIQHSRAHESSPDCFSTITPDTSLLLLYHSDTACVTDACENESQAEILGLKSFSAFRESDGPFEALTTLVHQKWEQYTKEPDWVLRRHGFPQYPACLGQEILAYFFILSKVMRLRECRNDVCEQRREAIERAMPRCGWPGLEALAARILACWMPNAILVFLVILLDVMPEEGRGVFRDGFEANEYNARSLVYEVEKLPRVSCLEVDGVIDLCRWMFRIAYGGNWSDEPRLCGRPTDEYNQLEALLFRLNPYYEAKAVKISRDYHGRGPCPNRLWNVSMLGSGGVADFPQVAKMAIGKVTTLEGPENPHYHCTEQLCLFSHQNSTLVAQRHICESGGCGLVTLFPKNILNLAFTRAKKAADGTPQQSPWACSAWNTAADNPSLCEAEEKYMAISHVWADGTGERSRDSGEVNTCLMNYFTRIAKSLDCSAIWWDAISIPTGPQRTMAIDSMLTNYENAAVTLVHDLELVNFEWRNDGSPAVALILSSWFTRGWTAAELFASRNHPVKVLFKNPKGIDGQPLIKDLDKDILAWDPRSIRSVDLDNMEALEEFGISRTKQLLDQAELVPSYGHFIATDILRRLRDGGASGVTTISSLRDLLLNLRARVTSWVKDQLVIPGLMCLNSFDSTATGPQITRELLSHFGEVFCSDLFHGEVPITPCGPWSWCPSSIFDLGMSHNSLSRRPSAKCAVTKGGLLSGNFIAYTLTREDTVVPFGRHPAMASRISEALCDRRNCMLLTDQSDRDQAHRQYILASPVWVGWVGKTLVVSCRWAGCVYLGTPAAIESHEGNRPPLNKSHITAEELSFSNQRIRFGRPRPVSFLFGADTSDDGCPFPNMKPTAVNIALSRYETATLDRRGTCKWPIGTEIEKDDGTFQWKRRAHPVCIYPLNTVERLGQGDDDVHSSLDAIIDETRDRNALDPSVVAKLPFYCKEEPALQACEIKHLGCSGIVHLAWSFPHGPIVDKPILRRIFRSPFHIMKTGWTDVDIRIGWLTYSSEIAPHCTRVRARSSSETEDTHIQVLLSSITEGSMAALDWNGPLREIESRERRPRKFSSSNDLRGDTKGPTFDKMLRDMGKEGR